MRPFHLAFAVHDLDAARAFYVGTLGCAEGRSSATWIDFDLYGHQITVHLSGKRAVDVVTSDVDGKSAQLVNEVVSRRSLGWLGQEDLIAGARAHLAGDTHDYKAFKHPIAFNLIPQIGSPKHEGYTSEEMKMVWETHKILGDDTIRVCPTCIRVPVSNCHSESILVETERKLSVAEARELFSSFPGITVVDDLPAGVYPMPKQCSAVA